MNLEFFKDPKLQDFPHTSLAKLFWARVAKGHNKIAAQEQVDGQWKNWTWYFLAQEVERVSRALHALGIQNGDIVGICLPTSLTWEIIDFALASLGAISCSLYERNLVEENIQLINFCKTKAIFVEDDLFVQNLKPPSPHLKKIILLQKKQKSKIEHPQMIAWDQFINLPKEPSSLNLEKSILQTSLDSPHTIVFTSGTTDLPKGVLLNNRNFVSVILKLKIRIWGFSPKMLMHLPFSHVLQRTALYRRLTSGFISVYPEKTHKIESQISEIPTHILVTVPRVLEKLQKRFLKKMEELPQFFKRVTQWALEVNLHWLRFWNKTKPFAFRFFHWVALFILNRFRKTIFGSRLRVIACGGAPLDESLERFYWAIGIKLFQGYGLTETTAPISVNTPKTFRFGTVGKPLKGIDVKIGEGEEILIRGESVFSEYFNNPKATQEALRDGWFHTGDLGEMDDDGFLKIKGRKKDLIVLSTGKKVVPTPIEFYFQKIPGVEEACVIGDGYPYLCAILFVLDRNHMNKIKLKLEEKRQEYNKDKAHFEKVQKIGVVPEIPSVENLGLTPTLKLRRQAILKRFQSLIQELYEQPNDQQKGKQSTIDKGTPHIHLY